MVQALAGSTRAGERSAPFDEAIALFRRRDEYDFHSLWCCSDDVTLLELARAARAIGRAEAVRDLFSQALDAGSAEALTESFP